MPCVTRYRDPVGMWQEGHADTEVTQARMWLPMQRDEHVAAPGEPVACVVQL
jgi:hypothetical protein